MHLLIITVIGFEVWRVVHLVKAAADLKVLLQGNIAREYGICVEPLVVVKTCQCVLDLRVKITINEGRDAVAGKKGCFIGFLKIQSSHIFTI